ncbi:hypothetical protein U14_05143 [Candidatus Moduliflexus flocculans]|uniref:Uncharacterized protein n=1 Tax=Candidatus Moduliflexus flocculans TaxID=1499966 RepID=A0A081BR37_9BACT|nr:hypothetical protein U14_05143 [Candidatus Moduliflexus flocculans]
MKDEELVELRAIRHEISLEFGHDIHRYVAYLQCQEEEYRVQIRNAERMLATQETYSDNPPLRKAA